MSDRGRAFIGLLMMGALSGYIGWNARGTWGRWHNDVIYDQCTGLGITPEAGGASLIIEGEPEYKFPSVEALSRACVDAMKAVGR